MAIRNVVTVAGLLTALAVVLVIGNRTKKHGSQSPARHVDVGIDVRIPTPIDLGTIWVGEEATIAVPILNRSRDAVNVKIKSTSCGCTDAAIDTERFEPGETATLLVTINTAKKVRRLVESIAIEAVSTQPEHAPHTHLYQVDVGGEIDQRYGLFPSQLDFGRVRRGTGAVTQQFRLVTDPQSQVHVDGVRDGVGMACLQMDLSQLAVEDGSIVWQGTLILDPDDARPDATALDTQIVIPVESSGVLRELKLGVRASLGFPVEHMPNMLYWSASNRDSKQYLQFDAVGGSSITIADIRCPDAPFLEFVVKENGSPHPIVEATCTLEHVRAIVRTEVRIAVEYGSSGSQVIRVPVLIM